ncbi:hypothetical protein EHQ68_01355 [Leptospira congkakensis]|uniref:Uncharacterized protein n=1 Tax=Leptospira congkakensis TaxID=2484932 RepID=A0A4Z1A541_9LEPT|nr:hypothetical protein [Leptospira congkakensis]TGL90107.1 hypothetical protein EHQ69_09120 [Leptospira congkakensis]TGL91114.1 hypothetical protein EHQ68_01355 [Leptospira congkakensis]TGL97894.1 hypothetical protein EHQ70_05750 [Leptospira congkakensis]
MLAIKRKIISPLIFFIFIINCRDLNRLPNFLTFSRESNKYTSIVDPSLRKYLISTNDLWISIDENDMELKNFENNNFKDTKYLLRKGELFEIIGGYPSIDNVEMYLIYQPSAIHWVSAKTKKQIAMDNAHIKLSYLEQFDFTYSKVLAAKYGGILIYEKPDFKSTVLFKVNEYENNWLWKIKPEFKNENPIYFLSATETKDRKFNKLGNWINISYKNVNGFVFSSDVIPIAEHCSKIPIINKSNKLPKKESLINSYGDNILYRYGLGDNLWGILIKEDKFYSYALTKTAYYCGERRNFHVVKIIDIKTFLSPTPVEFNATQVGGGIFCKNKEHIGTDMFIIYNEQIAKNNIKNTFSIDANTQRIFELNSAKTTCEDICDKNDCD